MTKYFHLSSVLLFKITGKDSERYLHNRLSNDIKRLGIGKGCYAAALSPQGRAQGFFAVLREGPQEFLLLCDGGDPVEVSAGLKRFLVADRVTVEELHKEYALYHLPALPSFFEEAELSQELSFYLKEGLYGIRRTRGSSAGIDLLLPLSKIQLLEELQPFQGMVQGTPQEYLLHRLRGKVLSFPEEINDKTLFSEAERSDAVSFNKGCYVGQEVIEKVDAFGTLPKRITRVIIPSLKEVSPGELISQGEESVGKVLSAVIDPEKEVLLCFASIKTDVPEGSTVQVNGSEGIIQ